MSALLPIADLGRPIQVSICRRFMSARPSSKGASASGRPSFALARSPDRFVRIIHRVEKGPRLFQISSKPQPRISEAGELFYCLGGRRGLGKSHAIESVLTTFFGIAWHFGLHSDAFPRRRSSIDSKAFVSCPCGIRALQQEARPLTLMTQPGFRQPGG
jgi:hypothetical protein